MRTVRDDHHEPELNEEMKKLLDLTAHDFLAEELPTLHALVRSAVEAGTSKESILAFCAQRKGMNEGLMRSIEGTIDHVERIVAPRWRTR